MSAPTLVTEETHHTDRLPKWLVGVAAVVMLSGLRFGYEQGVIGGALDGIEQRFNVSTFAIEVITSWVTLGALVGVFIWFLQRETKGRSLAEIQQMWEDRAGPEPDAGPTRTLEGANR